MARLATWVANNVWARHNSSRNIALAVERFLTESSPPDSFVLNLGSGRGRLIPTIVNLDVIEAPDVDIVASASDIPLPDGSVDRIISQELFEHLADDKGAFREC